VCISHTQYTERCNRCKTVFINSFLEGLGQVPNFLKSRLALYPIWEEGVDGRRRSGEEGGEERRRKEEMRGEERRRRTRKKWKEGGGEEKRKMEKKRGGE
jgi:hypothetical protein